MPVDVGSAVGYLDLDYSGFVQGFRTAQTESINSMKNIESNIGNRMESLGSKLSSFGGKLTKTVSLPILGVGTVGLKTAANFESAMSKVSAISGATGIDLDNLNKKAQEMGAKTKFSATESAEAFTYMAMAGWKTEEMLQGIDGIMSLAAADGLDLATTSDIVTDALTAFGLSAKDSGHFADVLAKASSNANTNVSMLGESFKYAAPVAGALGYSAEDTAIALGLMANAGIKSSQAGTALRSSLSRLVKPTNEVQSAMDRYQISITNSDGSMKSLGTVMDDLRSKLGNLTEAEQAQAAAQIFGQEAMSGMLAIINASQSDYNKLTVAIKNADGAANKMADTMLDNLSGNVTILKSSLEGLGIELGNILIPKIKQGVSWVQKATNYIQKLNTKQKENILKWAAIAVAIGPVNLVLGKLLTTGGKVINLGSKLITFAKSTATAFGNAKLQLALFSAGQDAAAIKSGILSGALTANEVLVGVLTGKITLATAAQYAWNTAVAAHPLGALLTVLGLVTAGIVAYTLAHKESAEQEPLVTEAQQKIIDKAKEEKKAWDELTDSKNKEAKQTMASTEYISGLVGEIEGLITANNLTVDSNGKLVDSTGQVHKAEQDRAQFIISQLNEYLGEEYSSLLDIVDANGKVKQSIYDTMNAKKADMLLESYNEVYLDSIKKVSDAEAARATALQVYSKQEEIYNAAQEKYLKARMEYQEKVAQAKTESDYRALASTANYVQKLSEESEKEKKILDSKREEYNKTDETVKGYYYNIDTYEEAQTKALSGNVDEAIKLLGKYSDGYKEATSNIKKSLDQQKSDARQHVIDTQVQLGILEDEYDRNQKNMTDYQKAQMEKRIKQAKEEANKACDEFSNLGGNISDGIAKGVNDKDWTVVGAIKSVVKKAINAAKKALDSHSPSRVFSKLGVTIPQGLGVGVKKDESKAINSVKALTNEMVKSFDTSSFKYKEGFGNSLRAMMNKFKVAFDIPNFDKSINYSLSNVDGNKTLNRDDSAINKMMDKLEDWIKNNKPKKVVTKLTIDGREFAIAEAPYIEEELGFNV